MLGSMKNGQSCRKMTGQVGEDAVSGVHLGELGKACLFLCLVFGDEGAAACWALSQEGLMSCFRGEGQGEGQSGCPVSAIFSDAFHLKYLSGILGIKMGLRVPNPITCIFRACQAER